jgi:hypothetical protein
MRTKEKLNSIEDMTILFKYLYLNKENFIVYNNGICNIKLFMNENGRTFSNIADDLEDKPTVKKLDVPEIFAIIKQLKYKKEWNKIVSFVRINNSLNY